MTQEEKAKAYDRVAKEVKDFFEGRKKIYSDINQTLEYLFPELKESEDERIRKGIISGMKALQEKGKYTCFANIPMDKVFAWLEKQGEQKPDDKVEPKFKVGDWVVSPNGVYWHIDAIQNGRYEVTADTGQCGNWPLDTNIYRLWTIQDAKNGDVLCINYGGPKPFIFSKNNCHHAYCALNSFGEFILEPAEWLIKTNVSPATKEQRDLLFKKMHEAGYEWDAEKKELKKIDEIEELFRNSDVEVDSNEDGLIAATIKYKNEQKHTWSEEDECYMAECINAIATKDGWSFEEKRKTKHWLKSLKDKYTWKPSIAQLNALSIVSKGNAPDDIEAIVSLYNDLKKLTE